MEMTPPNPKMGNAPADIAPLAGAPCRLTREVSSLPIIAPLTGVYYATPSPEEPPFVAVGDVVSAGQVVALIEAMKVFNEIQAEVAGRVTTIAAGQGNVVQEGAGALRAEPR